MAKVLKNFRLDPDVIADLDVLVNFYRRVSDDMDMLPDSRVSAAGVVAHAIRRLRQDLQDDGYDLVLKCHFCGSADHNLSSVKVGDQWVYVCDECAFKDKN